MNSQAILAAAGETGFVTEPEKSVWTISFWHGEAHARFAAQRTTAGDWRFTLIYAGAVHIVEPIDGADLIRILNDTLGAGARSASAANGKEE